MGDGFNAVARGMPTWYCRRVACRCQKRIVSGADCWRCRGVCLDVLMQCTWVGCMSCQMNLGACEGGGSISEHAALSNTGESVNLRHENYRKPFATHQDEGEHTMHLLAGRLGGEAAA